jgi:hypothetical protein
MHVSRGGSSRAAATSLPAISDSETHMPGGCKQLVVPTVLW